MADSIDAARDTARALSDYCNKFHASDALARAMANDHPTLQQGMMRVVRAYIREMAAKQYVDARNEGSHEMAKRIVADWEANGEPHLPLI